LAHGVDTTQQTYTQRNRHTDRKTDAKREKRERERETGTIRQRASCVTELQLNAISLHRKPISKLQSITHHMGSQCYLPPVTGERAPP